MKSFGKLNFGKMNIGGYLLFIIGVLLSVVLIRSLIIDVPVWFFGRKTTAIIDEVWYEYLEEDNLYPEYYIKIHFQTSKGETIYSIVSVPESTWSMYSPGEETRVRYFPLDPSNNRLDDSRIITLLLCTNIPFIVLCLFLIFTGREMIKD